jgi:hypothetical protein
MGAIPAYPDSVLLEPLFLEGDGQIVLGLLGVDILLPVEHPEMASDDLLGRIALDSFGARVPGRNQAPRIQHEDRILAGALHHRAKQTIFSPPEDRFYRRDGGDV